MSRDPDKEKTLMDILAKCNGWTTKLDDEAITVIIPARSDQSFRAHLASNKLVWDRDFWSSGDDMTDHNRYKVRC